MLLILFNTPKLKTYLTIQKAELVTTFKRFVGHVFEIAAALAKAASKTAQKDLTVQAGKKLLSKDPIKEIAYTELENFPSNVNTNTNSDIITTKTCSTPVNNSASDKLNAISPAKKKTPVADSIKKVTTNIWDNISNLAKKSVHVKEKLLEHPHVSNSSEEQSTLNIDSQTVNESSLVLYKEPCYAVLGIKNDNIAKIIEKALKEDIIQYEDLKEGKNLGQLILTSRGRDLYFEYLTNNKNKFVVADHIPDKNVTFKLCLVRPCKDTTIVIDGRQIHFLVYYEHSSGKNIGVGYLTSEETKFKLANSQQLSGNLNKKQFFQVFQNPIMFYNYDIEQYIGNFGSNYFLDPEKINIVTTAILSSNNLEPIRYTQGVVTEPILETITEQSILKRQADELANEVAKKMALDKYNKMNSHAKDEVDKKINNMIKQKEREYVLKNIVYTPTQEDKKQLLVDFFNNRTKK